jgi:hypothetical protein
MNFLERQLEDPVRLSRIKRFCYVILAVVVLTEVAGSIFFHADHHLSIEGWPAFGSIYGLVSCVLIIVISKFLGKVWLMRREDHYDS